MPDQPTPLPATAAEVAADLYLPSIVTAKVFAQHIDVSVRTAQRLFRQQAFPARKVAGKWVASKVAILMWLSAPDPVPLRVLDGARP